MHLINRRITIPNLRDQVRIVAMGCVHHGAAGADEELADFWYDYILTKPNTYVILGGDLVDSIHEKDKRYFEGEVAGWCKDPKWGKTLIERQRKYGLAKWRPLAKAGKILWIHSGNHEWKLVKQDSTDLTGYWCEELGVPYAGLAALSNLFVTTGGKAIYRVSFFTQHGGGGAQTDGAVLNKATAMLAGYDVDVALMWHLHKKVHMTKTMHGITETGRRKVRERAAAVCGAFLDGHKEGIDSYAELKGYTPVPLGPVVVHFKREVVNSIKGDPDRATGYTRVWISDAIRED